MCGVVFGGRAAADRASAAAVHTVFYCGNLGMILLNLLNAPHVREVLEKMVTVTMMRGAQSGGIVTYLPDGEGFRGSRSRVVRCHTLLPLASAA